MGYNVEELARWWTAATKEERFRLLKLSIESKAPKAPKLAELKLAIFLAEAEAGEIDQR